MRLIHIILLILTLNNCRHYFVRDAAKYNLTQEEENILKSKKIGVVGFHPFYNESDECCDNRQILSSNLVKALQFIYEKKNDTDQIPFNSNHFVTGIGKQRRDQRLSVERTTRYYFKSWRPLEKSNLVKPDKSISENNLRIFLKTYLEKTKHLGHREILELLDFSDKNKFYLKENDFDYWIIGFHSPRNYDISAEAILTFYPSIFTLGLFPFFDHDEIKSSFWIFDKKLNLLKKIEFENDYTLYITALWVIWKSDNNIIFNNNIPIDVYEPDLKEFQKEFVKIIKNREN
jgi:hypothetical protein